MLSVASPITKGWRLTVLDEDRVRRAGHPTHQRNGKTKRADP